MLAHWASRTKRCRIADTAIRREMGVEHLRMATRCSSRRRVTSVAFRKRHDSRSQRLAGVGPGEGLGALGRVGTDVLHDLRDELGLRVPDRVLEHVAGEDAEPDLDLVQPRGVGGREVQGEPPPLGRPGEPLLCLCTERLSRMTCSSVRGWAR